MFRKNFSDTAAHRWHFYSDTRLHRCRSLSDGRNELRELLAALRVRRPLVLSDANVIQSLSFAGLMATFDWSVALIGTEHDSTRLDEAVTKLSSGRHDGLIAIGGGSVIDAAKLLAATPNGDCVALLHTENALIPSMPLIAVPTTFGTGAEMNMVSHLYVDGTKRSLRRHWLAPSVALVVTEIAGQVPERLRYFGVLDAYCHALEARDLRRENSPLQRTLCDAALELIAQHGLAYIDKPDWENAAAIATASSYGGLIVNNARTGLIHALATPLAAATKSAHAESLRPCVLPALRFNQAREPDMHRAQALVERGAAWGNIDMSTLVLDGLVDAVFTDTVLLKENPVAYRREDVIEMFMGVLGDQTNHNPERTCQRADRD